ncbi:2,3-bisphosphoglycerate-dependent phosphoglycerate mutase [archaeon]|jgi:2,3-bisphosphoglycerate-dependent phosphoglycerate mutase|nr:2,3-bisphosphoglycerate-dependent phosphoglycerate mutase [archaeon]MBT4352389.1 2,3-bisphosphoglycerate-dependent phosphoglycerate mutase [archaeon]MBT4648318.1 2,3-bisphosphoglycerate-dependent phosphoglycerate mutase [archaeon]MBT7391798.1 2,3-bisphosphoglycerate-dependent phosphoglycerate mutase [archaeon]
MALLVLIRHGQSQWNLENRFTGWVDVPLSKKGRDEATSAGVKIADINFDIAYTSTLRRAHQTLLLAMSETKTEKTPIFFHNKGRAKEWQHHEGVPKYELKVIMDEALNERYYGDLQGFNKDEMRKKVGDEQVHIWRRSFATPPPNGESLKDTCTRTTPYLKNEIFESLKSGSNVLVSAHGNSLRAIVKELDKVADDEIPNVEIPTGVPYVYEFDLNMKILSKKILN